MNRRYMRDVLVNYEQQSHATVLSPGQGNQLALYATHLLNRCGAAQDLAILIRLAEAGLGFLTYTAPGPAVDATSAIFANTPQTIFSTTNNDGFVIQSAKPFNLIGFNVTQVETGAPTYSYQYWDGAAFTALPNIINTPDYTSASNQVLLFPTPRLWVTGTDPAVGGTSGLYTIFAQATTAPTQAVIVDELWVGHMLAFMPNVADGAQLSLMYDDVYPRLLDGLEGLLPFFETPNAANLVTAKYFNYG